MTDDTLKLYVTLGHPGDGSFNLRMSPSIADEVRALLDEHGVPHGRIAEFSSGPELVVEAVKVLGIVGGSATGLRELARVIITVIKRHDGKRVLIDGDKFEATGYSEKGIERLLEMRAEEQARQDKEWERIQAELPAPETPRDHE